MELKPGYKRTEVGVIPEDWATHILSDIAMRDAPICYGIVQVGSHIANGIPVIAIKNLDSDYFGENVHRTSPDKEGVYARSRTRHNDVLISVKGSTGRIGLVPKGFIGNISRDIARLRPQDEFLPEFCYYMLCSPTVQQRLGTATVGTTRMELSIGTLKQIPIPFPLTKAEQEAIAEALSDADALIDSLEQLITKKRHLKQGAMQELLTGKRRLPGFDGKWEAKTLGTIASVKTGGRNNEDKISDGAYPFFVRSQTVERINTFSYDCEAILIPGEGGIGSIFHYIIGRFDVHQRVYAITDFSPIIDAKYIYLYITLTFGAHALENSVKATVDSLRLPTFLNFIVNLPPTRDEQTAIAAVLSDMDAEIATLETKLAKARQIKQGMMQELLTGRIRLVNGSTGRNVNGGCHAG